MELNQSTLRGILAQITSVNEKYIVPKQGNWWNPQEQIQKPDTWCAYVIRSNRPVTVPFYNEGDLSGVPQNGVATLKIANIDLQFVGPQAEEIAQNVAMWPLRADVQAEFKKVNGALMNDAMEAASSNFYQNGTNNVMAWNVSIRVQWYHVMDINQDQMPFIQFEGK